MNMSKKSIAALVAGATLLAGFAMATPAMAEDLGLPPVVTSDPLDGSYNGEPAAVENNAPAKPAKKSGKAAAAPEVQVPDRSNCYKNYYGTVVCVPATKPLYDKALSGKFDDPVAPAKPAAKPAKEAKPAAKPAAKSASKEAALPKTGVAVALVAVAASALSGMGVALRKFRH